MEFITSDTRSDTLIKMLAKSNIEGKTAKRRDGEIVYIRKGDDVVACARHWRAAIDAAAPRDAPLPPDTWPQPSLDPRQS